MTIELPQYLNEEQRLEYIKILHKLESSIYRSSSYWNGYHDAIKHVEMFLSGAIKEIKITKNEDL